MARQPALIGCYDRILLNGLIQPFQQAERVIGFLAATRCGASPTAFSNS